MFEQEHKSDFVHILLYYCTQRDALNQKVEALTAKTEQLSTLLRSVQQVQVQPSLPAPGAVGNQSFRVGATVPRLSSVRTLAALDTTDTTPSHNASFRMGGKPPIAQAAGGFTVPRTPIIFNGGGTIQRNRGSTPKISPVVTQATSPSHSSVKSDSTTSSYEDLTRLDSPGPATNPSVAEDRFHTPMDLREDSPDEAQAPAEVEETLDPVRESEEIMSL